MTDEKDDEYWENFQTCPDGFCLCWSRCNSNCPGYDSPDCNISDDERKEHGIPPLPVQREAPR